MLFSLGLVLLVLGITLFQATQGFFSALLMTVLTICCAAAAFGTFEFVAQNWLAPLWKPDFAYSIALGLTFAVPLFALRLGLDRLVRRSSLIPAMIDRVGGGICGFVTAMICVGVLACSVLWLPHGTGFIGFSRVDVPAKPSRSDTTTATPPNPEAPMRELLMTPDRFAVKVASMLSEGLFSGRQTLSQSHPDLVLEFGETGAVPAEVMRYAPPNSLTFIGTEVVQQVYKETPAVEGGGGRRGSQENEGTPANLEPLSPKAGHEFRVVRVGLKKEAKDQRKSHVFTLRQFRLVGRVGNDGPAQEYHAVAVQQRANEDTIETVNRHIRVIKTSVGDWHVMDDPYHPRRNDETEVVFEVPKGFVPEYIQYKRGARAAVSLDKTPSRTGEPETSAQEGASGEATAEGGSRRRRSEPQPETTAEAPQGGNVKRYTVRTGQSFFGDQTPLTLTKYTKPAANVEVRRGALSAGHLIANLDEQEGGTDTAISKFEVPQDKRLLQLNTGYLQARSGLGRALSFAVETLQNYQVEGDNGQVYEVVGKYAIADVDGRQVCEMQYFSEKAGTLGQLTPFNRVKNTHLKGDYEYVLLFLIDPGVTITSFSTGGAAARRDDLRAEGLKAPD